MSESEVVGKIIEILVQEKGLEKELIHQNPNQKDIQDQIIRDILSRASKQKTEQGGRLDFLYLNKKDKLVILGEMKEFTSNHKKAIKDIKHYLNYFLSLNSYKIVGLAVSGEFSSKFDYQVDTFIIKKKQIVDTKNKALLGKNKYLNLFQSASDKEKDDLEKVKKIARETSELLMGLTVAKKPIVIAGALITLYHQEGKEEKTIHQKLREKVIENLQYQNLLQKEKWQPLKGNEIEKLGEEIKKNFSLGDGENPSDLILTLKESFPSSEKTKTSDERDKKIKIVSRIIETVIKDSALSDTVLVNVFLKVYQIQKIIITQRYDLTAEFYKTFLKYWSGDGQDLGIVLTPWHITELMVDLIEIFKGDITAKDTCLDPCAGTGTFLLSFLNKQVRKYNNIEQAKKNLIGIERNEEMYVLSVANMLCRGDGKANLYLTSCFDFNQIDFSQTPNIGLMNPPYSQDKQIIDGKSEIEFVGKLSAFIKNGFFAVIVPISTFTNKTTINIKKREEVYKNHTLKAIINMPPKLFSPILVHTCVAIFQTETSHDPSSEVYFYNLSDDGFEVKDETRQDYHKKWLGIKEKFLSRVKKREEIKEISFSWFVKAEDEWTFNSCRQKKEHEENFTPLFTEKGKSFFEKTISDFLLYKIKEKAEVLDLELKINEAEKSGETSEKEKLKNDLSAEWIMIHNYLLYKWKEKEKVIELKTTDKLGKNLHFLKKLVFADLDLEKEVSYQTLELNLTDREWKSFQVEEIFDLEQGSQYRREDIQWGDYYYVTHSGKNNGIWCKAKIDEQDCFKNVITVSASVGVNFYQDKPFITCKEIHKLKLKSKFSHSLNLGIGLFLNTILSFNYKYYNRYDRRSQDRLLEELIKLPVNKDKTRYLERIESSDYILRKDREETIKKTLPNGKLLIQYAEYEPDWEFMDIYIYIYSKRLIEKARI